MKKVIIGSERKLQFLKSLIDSKDQSCIQWPFTLNSDGYGQLWYQGKKQSAPSVMLQLLTDRPDGHSALHMPLVCHNRSCVNPNHLYWGTQKQNVKDKKTDGTLVKGESIHCARFTESQVREIRNSKTPSSKLAKMHGVSYIAIWSIRTRRTWAHVG